MYIYIVRIYIWYIGYIRTLSPAHYSLLAQIVTVTVKLEICLCVIEFSFDININMNISMIININISININIDPLPGGGCAISIMHGVVYN